MKNYCIVRAVAFLVLGLLGFMFITSDIEIPRIEFVLESILTVSTTLTGFLFTGITLLVGFTSKLLEKISDSRSAFRELKARCLEAIILGIVVVVLCIMCGACLRENDQISVWWLRMFLFIGGWFTVSFVEVSYYLVRIFLTPSNGFPIHNTRKKGIPENFLRKQ